MNNIMNKNSQGVYLFYLEDSIPTLGTWNLNAQNNVYNKQGFANNSTD